MNLNDFCDLFNLILFPKIKKKIEYEFDMDEINFLENNASTHDIQIEEWLYFLNNNINVKKICKK